jgi:predicted acyltransferase
MNIFKQTDADGMVHSPWQWLYQNIFAKINDGEFGSLLFSVAYTSVIWAVCWILWKRKIYVKL